MQGPLFRLSPMNTGSKPGHPFHVLEHPGLNGSWIAVRTCYPREQRERIWSGAVRQIGLDQPFFQLGCCERSTGVPGEFGVQRLGSLENSSEFCGSEARSDIRRPREDHRDQRSVKSKTLKVAGLDGAVVCFHNSEPAPLWPARGFVLMPASVADLSTPGSSSSISILEQEKTEDPAAFFL